MFKWSDLSEHITFARYDTPIEAFISLLPANFGFPSLWHFSLSVYIVFSGLNHSPEHFIGK
jgi:hypothetical protein